MDHVRQLLFMVIQVISSIRESQCNCWVFGNAIFTTWFVWRKPWTASGGCSPSLHETVDNGPPVRTRPCDLQKLINSLKLRKACGIYGTPNECLRHLPRRPLVHLTHLINHCLQ
jgi:hypothetical protein